MSIANEVSTAGVCKLQRCGCGVVAVSGTSVLARGWIIDSAKSGLFFSPLWDERGLTQQWVNAAQHNKRWVQGEKQDKGREKSNGDR